MCIEKTSIGVCFRCQFCDFQSHFTTLVRVAVVLHIAFNDYAIEGFCFVIRVDSSVLIFCFLIFCFSICHFFRPSVRRAPYLRNRTSSDHNFWYTCVK